MKEQRQCKNQQDENNEALDKEFQCEAHFYNSFSASYNTQNCRFGTWSLLKDLNLITS